ncbi:hypothetical protein FF125_01415 [Aureibaculum algae]|uniref:GlyGly-CTERM sorting domain-containing protein n=1 Tax=Aureibaculum algae TaxID=2584122 RepID=A0A5B7TP47_9FLAO|nr:hypothetical protein [Aureibaculum algae]QCX37161.1 hypothetical protein FF125_01415 [Aureibaculum algae]
MLKKYLIFLSFAVLVLTSSNVFAQGSGPEEPKGGPILPPTSPIDGGVGFLLVLGVGYAVKKLRKEN